MSLEKHLADTVEHRQKVQQILASFIAELTQRSIHHDDTKFEEPEAPLFAEVVDQLATLTYNSPKYKECLEKLKPALDHHYAKNTHHPQHYQDGIDGMDLMDLVEMIADWKASTERHNTGNIDKSMEVNRTRFKIDDQLYKILQNTVERYLK